LSFTANRNASRGSEQYQSTNSAIACSYVRCPLFGSKAVDDRGLRLFEIWKRKNSLGHFLLASGCGHSGRPAPLSGRMHTKFYPSPLGWVIAKSPASEFRTSSESRIPGVFAKVTVSAQLGPIGTYPRWCRRLENRHNAALLPKAAKGRHEYSEED
jgi:hypothetical protein